MHPFIALGQHLETLGYRVQIENFVSIEQYGSAPILNIQHPKITAIKQATFDQQSHRPHPTLYFYNSRPTYHLAEEFNPIEIDINDPNSTQQIEHHLEQFFSGAYDPK